MAWRKRAGGCDWSLRLPSSPRTIHGMMSWPPRASGSGSAESGLSLGLGLGGAKVMLNSREEEEEEVEREQVMRGSVRMGMRESEGLEKSEEESEEESEASAAAATEAIFGCRVFCFLQWIYIILFYFIFNWMGFFV